MKIRKSESNSSYEIVAAQIKQAITSMAGDVFSISDLRAKAKKSASEWPDSFIHQAAIEQGLVVED